MILPPPTTTTTAAETTISTTTTTIPEINPSAHLIYMICQSNSKDVHHLWYHIFQNHNQSIAQFIQYIQERIAYYFSVSSNISFPTMVAILVSTLNNTKRNNTSILSKRMTSFFYDSNYQAIRS